jgi:hypothetical protein
MLICWRFSCIDSVITLVWSRDGGCFLITLGEAWWILLLVVMALSGSVMKMTPHLIEVGVGGSPCSKK